MEVPETLNFDEIWENSMERTGYNNAFGPNKEYVKKKVTEYIKFIESEHKYERRTKLEIIEFLRRN